MHATSILTDVLTDHADHVNHADHPDHVSHAGHTGHTGRNNHATTVLIETEPGTTGSVQPQEGLEALEDRERMAPGHVYNPVTGTGIAWYPDHVELWEGGAVTEFSPHSTSSQWDFWYGLHFREAFPSVTHWWFGSAWTGKLWLRAITASEDGGLITGGMRFVDREEPEQLWHITVSTPVRVSTPLPPFEANPVNLPLRLILAEYCLGLRNGDVGASLSPQEEDEALAVLAEDEEVEELDLENQAVIDKALDMVSPPYLVTSLVSSENLEAAFPTALGARAWQLEGVDLPLREALCTAMGLEAPTPQWTLR